MSSHNTTSAWSKYPFAPQVVLQQLLQKDEITAQELKDTDRRPRTPLAGFLRFTGLDGESVTMLISPDKAEILNDLAIRYKQCPFVFLAVEGLVDQGRQALADRHIYKRTN